MRKKILIVDDDPSISKALATIFRNEGYRIDETTDSQQAIIFINKARHDAYLFDYKLRGLSGIDELCSEEIDSGLVAGIISKSFDLNALLQKIASIK